MKVPQRAVVLLLALAVSACSPLADAVKPVEFGVTHTTQYVKAGEYAVRVANDCGTRIETVAGQINGNGWADPILDGTPLRIPTSGDYTVVDPIGSDLTGDTPSCALALTVALTPTRG